MRNLLFFIFTTVSLSFAQAGSQVDTTTYEEQRTHVNNLLNKRAKRFGDLNQSLVQKTGIFGFVKSKKDMQNSINILQEIVRDDNLILVETRKLLTIKDNHASAYQQLASEYDEQVTAYMRTVSKLQAENEKLRLQINSMEEKESDNKGVFIIITLLLLLLSIFIYKGIIAKKQKLT